jgi:polyisoprenoid-binding protein YceI
MILVRTSRIALLLLLPCAAVAQETLHVDPAKSEVQFALGDPIHSVHGNFHVQSGTVTFDRASGQMSGGIAVDASSGESGNESRDKKMKTDELKASTYSTVTFAPSHFSGKISPTGDSTITVDGTFTLIGVPHQISVPMQVHLEGGQCKATGSFVVPYVKWGMKNPSTFVLRVGKEVTVNLNLVGIVSGAGAE